MLEAMLIPEVIKHCQLTISDFGILSYLILTFINCFLRVTVVYITRLVLSHCSLHEMGYYDDAAFIEYISKTRSSKVFYVGYSLGTLTFSIMAAERPEVAKKVKAMVALAPAIYMGNIDHRLVHLIARYQKEIQALAQLFKIHELFGHSRVFDYMGNYMCRLHLIGDHVCSQIFYFILGYSPKQLDKSRLPIIFTKYPSGMSFKSFYHILQLISSNGLQKFDYGLVENMNIYNSSTPPKYNISRINIPTAVFLSKTDPLSTEQDALRFYDELPEKLGLHYIDRTFNHLDFIIGKDISEVINTKIVDIFS